MKKGNRLLTVSICISANIVYTAVKHMSSAVQSPQNTLEQSYHVEILL